MRTSIAVAITLLVISPLQGPIWGGPDKENPSQNRAFAVVEFSQLPFVPGNGSHAKLRLKAVAHDGTAWDLPISFQGLSKSAGRLVAISVETSMDMSGWDVVRVSEADWIAIHSHVDGLGKRSPIKEIALMSEGAYPVELLPTVIASENVAVKREDGVAKKAAKPNGGVTLDGGKGTRCTDFAPIQKAKGHLDAKITLKATAAAGAKFQRGVIIKGPATKNTPASVLLAFKTLLEAEGWTAKEVGKSELSIQGKKGSELREISLSVEGLEKDCRPVLKKLKQK